ncbi:MAG TPA: endonuclease/exonuclease/phosphatase family protein, partial [Fimbriimonadaceae bacterium]|nr:endonuclease/exonuclease/phosphatase family protein [Fimbriimonadaceae bacterium]
MVFCLALGLYCKHTAADAWWSLPLTFAPLVYFAFPWLPLIISSLFRKNRPALWLNIASGAVLLYILAPGVRLGRERSPAGPDTLKVMTFNIQHGLGGIDNVVRTIEFARPDVILFQKATPFTNDVRDPRLKTITGSYHVVARGARAIATRWPVLGEKYVLLDQADKMWAQVVAIRVAGKPVYLVNVHLSATMWDRYLLEPKKIPPHLRSVTRIRAGQVDRLLQLTGDLPGPVILGGDFNNPPRGA